MTQACARPHPPGMGVDWNDLRPVLHHTKLEGLHGAGAPEPLIREAEAALQVRFPDSYRRFLGEFGWGYFGALELIAGLGGDIPTAQARGTNVVHVTLDERQGPLRLPATVIPFYGNGAGDWYALDCRLRHAGESPVVLVAHERAISTGWNPEPSAASFADWVLRGLALP